MTDYEIYRKVQHEFYLEDARNFVREYLENVDDRALDVDDITEEELDGYDYEYLVSEYENRQDCNVAFNDTWHGVVRDYFTVKIRGM